MINYRTGKFIFLAKGNCVSELLETNNSYHTI